jgi:hypothetical protein
MKTKTILIAAFAVLLGVVLLAPAVIAANGMSSGTGTQARDGSCGTCTGTCDGTPDMMQNRTQDRNCTAAQDGTGPLSGGVGAMNMQMTQMRQCGSEKNARNCVALSGPA